MPPTLIVCLRLCVSMCLCVSLSFNFCVKEREGRDKTRPRSLSVGLVEHAIPPALIFYLCLCVCARLSIPFNLIAI